MYWNPPHFLDRDTRHQAACVLEMQAYDARRAVALLADDDFGHVVDLRHCALPIRVLVGTSRWLQALEIVFRTEDEHDDVGILFDGARFAQVGKQWPFVLALFDRARELRKGHDGTAKLAGQVLELP